jgi:predicted GIY-YIG superfamily endonuclease
MSKILNYGLNFIPTYFFDSFQLFYFLFQNIELEFSSLNKKLYILNSKKDSNIVDSNKDNDVHHHENYIDILHHFRSPNNPHSHPNHPLSLDLKHNFIKLVSKLDLNTNLNMNLNDILFLKKFVKNKPFEIVNCDKNIGSAIISHELYDKLVYEHLIDSNTYKLINYDPLDSIITKINNSLSNLFKHKQIDKKLYKKLFLIPKNCKLGKIRILPKLHKNKFGIRPIINSTNHPTSKLCKLIEVILGPHVKKLPSYIQDSQNLIQDCYKFHIPNNALLVSADIESLYTNIKLDHAIEILFEFARDKLPASTISALALKEILKLILENNYFTYKSNNYLQTTGIAMGCICGPTIANIVVHNLESYFISKYKPFYYKRYIDDIFMITDANFDLSIFSNSFDYLKLCVDSGPKINFLDLEISIDIVTNKLKFSLYTKPTNTYSYLRTDSNHPQFIFDNNPKSLLIRLRRICSDLTDYLYHSTLLIFRLVKRGYNYAKLIKIRHMVSNLIRDDLIPYKSKENIFSEDTILFKFPYDSNLFNNNSIRLFFKQNPIELNNKPIKIKIIHSTLPNLNSILVHKFNIPIAKKFQNKKCNKKTCKICKFINLKSEINVINNVSIPIFNNCDCEAKNGIYFIKCKLCNLFYIGESKDIKRRIGYHIGTIRNFTPFYKYHSLPIAHHFNLKDHNYNLHFEFSIFKCDIEDDTKRFQIETETIHFIKQMVPKILNNNIPNPPKYPKFIFSMN